MKIVSVVAACSLVAGLGLVAFAKEKPVKLKELPPAVRAVVEREAGPKGKIRGLDTETENGKTVYEAELTVAGHHKDISMDDSGNIVEIEETVALKTLPDAARAAIEKAAGRGKVLKVESISDGKQVIAYEADIRVKGKTTELRVDPQGNPAPKR